MSQTGPKVHGDLVKLADFAELVCTEPWKAMRFL